MVCLVAFDYVLRLVFRGMPLVTLESDLGSDLLLYYSRGTARFRLPPYPVTAFKFSFRAQWLPHNRAPYVVLQF